MRPNIFNVFGLESVRGQYQHRAHVRVQGIAEARRAARCFRERGDSTDVVIERITSFDPTTPITPFLHWRYVPTEDGLGAFWKKLTTDGQPLN